VRILTGSLMVCALGAFAWAEQPEVQHGNEPPMLGLHLAKGQASPFGGGSNANLTYHNGPVLPTSDVIPIFWGKSWGSSSFVGDKITGLADFYLGANGSNYIKTNTEYSGQGVQVGSTVNYLGYRPDTSAGPTSAPSTSTIINKVCSVIGSSNVTKNGYYPVYVDLKRGNAGYCAWHSWGSCGTTPIQVAFFFNLDADPGCDPGDTATTHSQGLAALANVSGHELSEAVTDPRGSGWYDRQGAENADKCAWSFNSQFVIFSNGTDWKIQGNWSNAAYTAGTGYANRSGQKGCIDGQ
jgi:hypothetical protein